MKVKQIVILGTILGSLLIGVSIIAEVVLQPNDDSIWGFIGGFGAGLLMCVTIAALIGWQRIRSGKEEREWQPEKGSGKLVFLVFGGLALVFSVFFLIFG